MVVRTTYPFCTEVDWSESRMATQGTFAQLLPPGPAKFGETRRSIIRAHVPTAQAEIETRPLRWLTGAEQLSQGVRTQSCHEVVRQEPAEVAHCATRRAQCQKPVSLLKTNHVWERRARHRVERYPGVADRPSGAGRTVARTSLRPWPAARPRARSIGDNPTGSSDSASSRRRTTEGCVNVVLASRPDA